MKHNSLVVIFLIAVLGFFALDILSNKPEIRKYCRSTEKFVQTNQPALSQIFSTTFDNARLCGNGELCKKTISEEIFSTLPKSFFELRYPESTYFIQVDNQGLIEKMFYSGEYYAKTPETYREKFVVWRLSHSRGICDLGWKNDISTTSMTYLRDITAEAEIIIPVGINNSAVVRLWGD